MNKFIEEAKKKEALVEWLSFQPVPWKPVHDNFAFKDLKKYETPKEKYEQVLSEIEDAYQRMGGKELDIVCISVGKNISYLLQASTSRKCPGVCLGVFANRYSAVQNNMLFPDEVVVYYVNTNTKIIFFDVVPKPQIRCVNDRKNPVRQRASGS